MPTCTIDTTKSLLLTRKWVNPKRPATNSHNLYQKPPQQVLSPNKFCVLIGE